MIHQFAALRQHVSIITSLWCCHSLTISVQSHESRKRSSAVDEQCSQLLYQWTDFDVLHGVSCGQVRTQLIRKTFCVRNFGNYMNDWILLRLACLPCTLLVLACSYSFFIFLVLCAAFYQYLMIMLMMMMTKFRHHWTLTPASRMTLLILASVIFHLTSLLCQRSFPVRLGRPYVWNVWGCRCEIFFTDLMPFLSPSQQCPSTDVKNWCAAW